MNVTITLTGTRPLIMHNGRLANPIDPRTRALKALTSIKKKTDDTLAQIALAEARAGFWETEDGDTAGVPVEAVYRAIRNAASASKSGRDVARALLFEPTTEPLLIDSKPVNCDAWLRDPANIDYRSVRNQQNRVMRARPKFPVGWQVRMQFELLDDVLDVSQVRQFLDRAGRLEGIGDWRPIFGRFSAETTT